jgi:uncharacterized protein (TIGR03437 family)
MPCAAATGFGTVVPIGGQAADIALDESRGLVYIANFTANQIDVLSTADNTIHTSINVSPQPGALALSPNAQYLLIAHFGNTTTPDPSQNLLTLINLRTNAQQTFITGAPPLGVAFYGGVPSGPGMALVVTTTGFFTMDPTNGVLSGLISFANLALTLPVATVPTFPGQILETALTTSGDHMTIWGIGGAGTGTQVIYTFNARTGVLNAINDVSSPALLNRVSVAYDGSYAMIGWAMFSNNAIIARYPNVISSANVTGHAIDETNNLIYAQVPDATQPAGPPYTPPTSAGSTPSASLPTLLLMAADNLTVLDRIRIPEDMVGRAVLNAAATMLYAVSDSGVMILPVGSLNSYHRLTTAQEDVLVQTTFCNRTSVAQPLTITDPGGGNTDFTITPSQAGVTVTPSSGTTPATVQVMVDPNQFQTKGTTVVSLTLSSQSAINMPKPVRLLVSNPDENQRGTIIDIPGVLSDIMADPMRNRFYVLRQDLNELLIYDGNTNQRIVALRTATTPTGMSMSNDQNFLLVTHNDSQLVTVYNLNTMLQVSPIVLPGGHYGRSVAQSNGQTLVLARNEGTGTGVIDSINLTYRTGVELASLGIFANSVPPTGVLASAPNGANILMAGPDGTVMLYSASADTFTVARKDFTALSGAYAASSYNNYVVGNNVLNSSAVPQGALDATLGTTSGFAFTGQGGYQLEAAATSSAGAIQNLPTLVGGTNNPTPTAEAPLLPTTSSAFTRTVAPLPSAGTVIALTVSGVTVLSANYAAATTPPAISTVSSAADGSASVAAGGLIAVYGSQMSPVNIATSTIPLPTALGESCLVVNGTPIPLLFVSSGQINAQLPFNVAGTATMSIHTPAGISNNFNFAVQSAAPSIFMSGSAGPETGLATIVRFDNGQLVTPTNPVHPGDTLVIYLTGMGSTSPAVNAGVAAPMSPLSWATQAPAVTLGGSPLTLLYATVPGTGVPDGTTIPLVINQGGGSTTLNVRVVN